MKLKILTILFVFFTLTNSNKAQHDINIKLAEADINNVLTALVDARGLNWGDYLGNILEAWFVNIEGATVNILSNNQVMVNVNVVAVLEIDIWHFVSVTSAHHLSGSFIGHFVVVGNQDGGFQIKFVPDYNTFSPLSPVNWGLLPNIEINLGTFFLPQEIQGLFTTGVPYLETNENEVILGFDFAGPRKITLQNDFSGYNAFEKIEVLQNEQWEPYDSPKDFWWVLNSTHQVRAKSNLVTYSNSDWKFNFWNENDNQKNPQKTVIADQGKQETAYFGQVLPLTVQTHLLEGGAGGKILYEGQEKNSPFIDYGFKPPYSTNIGVNNPQLINGKNYYLFNWQDGNTSTNRTISLTSPSTYTANLKGTQLSSEETAYANNSQRKFVRTNNGHLHCVYSSMNRVWYERSTNNGATWEIMNGGKPLDDSPSKSPSIDFLDYLYSQDQIIIAYQQFDGENTNLIISIFENGVKQSHNIAVSFDDTYFVYDLTPVISWHYSGRILLVYKDLSGLFFRYGNLVGTQQIIQWYGVPTFIVNTNADARNLSLAGLSGFYNNLLPFHLAWEEDFEIKYKMLSSSGSNYNSITQHQTEIISAQAGFRRHSHPSIIVWSDNSVRICWIGERGPDGLPNYTEGQEKTVVFTVPGTPNRFWTFGSGVTSTSINKTNDKYAIAWARGNSNLITFADNSTLRPVGTINISGKDVQLSNGTTSNTMYVLAFNTNALPYYMQTGLVNFNQQQEIEPIEEREGIVSEEEAQVYFSVGDATVDNEPINFVEIPDNVSITSQQTANQYLVSEPFSLTDNSEFFYSVKYGLTDSLAALSMLSSNKSLTFKVELLDAVTNEILGVFDEVTYDQGNIIPYEKVDYQVLTNGIGERTVKLRLVINSNFSPDYSIAEKYDTESGLAKKNYKQISYQGSLAVDNYDLSQNYPNPFNPTTTINYHIKEDGLVTLKLYNILGSEIRTLVNEEKTQGRYSYNFNASDLASGVYIYQLRVNDFVASKKLMLLK